MAAIYDCTVPAELLAGMRLSRAAIGRGELVVIPTDTVYGLAADAFSADAVQRLLDAKGRTRQSPPPVLIPNLRTLDALAENVSDAVRSLAEAFWPGGLTIVVPARSSLMWDLGETDGTVALRMPADPLALELLAETGPLAVSSANLTGQPAALNAEEAERMLGESVAVYLQSSAPETAPAGLASTIVDATDPERVSIIRHGVITEAQLREVIGDALVDPAAPVAPDPAAPAALEPPAAPEPPAASAAPPADESA
ncbi:L-threonylcarbamoyladenylate synthase [Subtercola lobariae]|uniref:L-threonylcarbamoyladenylate synthase n=1 Tax=Subtercola lobariae TaxID=1588641 RepID=A0A917B6J8_9MICO|nr:L-threonylcarbamoyladenylate synthase [Subtercola lobariae]GGF25657.1 threonylcarbamoyl-AMP synthase [Subtercola lobariae]